MSELIGREDTTKNFVPIGSIELKLVVAKAEGYTIRGDKTRYHHVVDGTVVTSVDESKPTYYYYNDNRLLPMLDPYRIAKQPRQFTNLVRQMQQGKRKPRYGLPSHPW